MRELTVTEQQVSSILQQIMQTGSDSSGRETIASLEAPLRTNDVQLLHWLENIDPECTMRFYAYKLLFDSYKRNAGMPLPTIQQSILDEIVGDYGIRQGAIKTFRVIKRLRGIGRENKWYALFVNESVLAMRDVQVSKSFREQSLEESVLIYDAAERQLKIKEASKSSPRG